MPDYLGLTSRRYDLDNVTPITIDGHPLDWYGVDPADGWLSIGKTETATSYQQVPGLSGDVDTTLEDEGGAAAVGRREIKLGLVISGDEQRAIDAKLRVGALIGRRIAIKWRALPGEYEGRASLDDEWTDTHLGQTFVQSTNTLTIDAEPFIRYPRVTLPLLDGEDSFMLNVAGNRPTKPRFILTPANGVQNFTVTDSATGRRMTIKLPATANGTMRLTADCETRTLRFGEALAGMTLDSDWFRLTPGRHTLTVSGAASGRTLSAGWISFQPLGLI